ncbi:ribokinase [Tunturiibacter empetritectus]|uniref:Ribokinase n=2 Tax=Tunturiibacter TaxID=3154218 RepID=A0A852VA30_9BACT|nr:ribokinase [Edaphobacter lichenicola]NYF88277.1 ribokinase [Edaphobacter lichenicola]
MPVEKKGVVVVGSINMDLVAYTARIPTEGETVVGTAFQTHPGGKGANQAVAVARLGFPVAMIGRIGDDAFGTQLKEHLKDAGVNVDGVSTSQCSSGVAVIVVSEAGENCIVITPGANAQLTPEDLDAKIEILRGAGMVLTQLEIPTETVQHLATICAREGVPLILDPAPAKQLPKDLLDKVDWFTPNETEAAFFIGDGEVEVDEPVMMARTLMRKGVRGVVLKLGSRGAYLASADGLSARLEPFAVQAVDSTAAGDAFNGAFATALMMKKDPVESARFAAAAAALSVTRTGAQTSMPRMAEVEQMLAGVGANEL